jgi:hypothetical protein
LDCLPLLVFEVLKSVHTFKGLKGCFC